jgi:hypothetical protein
MNHLMMITKSDGTRQLFEEEKLVSSLRRVGASEEAIDDVAEQVEKEMRDGIPTAEIYAKAFSLLKKHSMPTAVKYSIRRAMLELGPDGFPFERFVARIFKMWGYETVTDQALRGESVEHEMDVVAWKGEALAMAEAKYHNEFGMKSDLKVALYVKARFDDLAPVAFDYGGKKRKLTERWLFTNTKFTDRAITYGSFHGIKLVGWNYPQQGNLHQIIEENGLHPISSITTLNHQQKKDIIAAGILACRDLVDQQAVLKSIGLKPEEIQRAVMEAATIIKEAR